MKPTDTYDITFIDTYVNAKGITMYKYQVQGDDFSSYKLAQGSYYREYQGKPIYFTKHNLGKAWSIHHSLPRGFSSEEYIGSYYPAKHNCPDCGSNVNLVFGPVEDDIVTILCQKCHPFRYFDALP